MLLNDWACGSISILIHPIKALIEFFHADAEKNVYVLPVSIFTDPSARAGYDTRSIFKRSLIGFEFRVFLLLDKLPHQMKNLVCPTILPLAGGRIIGFIPFPRVLVLCEMQSVSSRIWTRVAVSISYHDNHYATGTSMYWRYRGIYIFAMKVSVFLYTCLYYDLLQKLSAPVVDLFYLKF